MNEPALATAPDQHQKDSCSYAVEIAKQFLTLASAGLAFLVGLALSAQGPVSWLWYLCAALLLISIGAGLAFVMSVVAHVNQEKRYDVYTGMLKRYSLVQIGSFFGAVILLALILFSLLGAKSNIARTDLYIKAGDREVTMIQSHGRLMA
jgi:hypothetical protein